MSALIELARSVDDGVELDEIAKLLRQANALLDIAERRERDIHRLFVFYRHYRQRLAYWQERQRQKEKRRIAQRAHGAAK